MSKYRVIYADPPWWFRDKANAGKRGAAHKYPCMRTADIAMLDVPSLIADDCLLAMWWVDTMPLDALEVCNAWGFRLFKMNGLIWRKTTKTGKQAFGMGHITRADSESMLFGVRGKLGEIIRSHGVRQSFYGELREHSRKPDEIYTILEALCGDVPRLEMFARQRRPGWDAFGNEVKGSIAIAPRQKRNAA